MTELRVEYKVRNGKWWWVQWQSCGYCSEIPAGGHWLEEN